MKLPLCCAVAFFFTASALAQHLTFTPFHDSGMYQEGETAGWMVKVDGETTATYAYTIRKNNSDTIKQGSLDLSKGSATIETSLNEPAMLYVEVTGAAAPTKSAAAAPTKSAAVAPIHLGAAIAPWKLKPSVPRPSDFDSFWEGKLRALQQIPTDPVLTKIPCDKPGVELYTVKLNSLGSHVQGYLAKPARDGKFPALVVFQYAGVYALRTSTVTDRAAEGWLALDVDSHDLPPDQATGVINTYNAIGNTSRETSYFLNMYLRDVRAVDYISTRADWDGKTIVATGGSMGGQQSLAAAGLNPKITAILINVPAGADSNGDLHGRKTGYPYWDSKNPKVMETALYFDTVNFTPRIKAPVLAAMGFIDTIAPPVGIWIALNGLLGPKEVIGMVESGHDNQTPEKQGAWHARSAEVLAQILKTGKFAPAQ